MSGNTISKGREPKKLFEPSFQLQVRLFGLILWLGQGIHTATSKVENLVRVSYC